MGTPKKRIAVIGLKGLPAFGGAAAVGEQLIRELKDDYDFTVYAVGSHTHLATGPADGFYQVVFRKSRIRKANTFFYFVKSLLHVLFVRRYDLVHVHHYSSGFIVPLLRLRYKVVVTLHGINRTQTFDPKFNSITNRLLKLSQWLNLRFANRIVSVSLPDTEYLNAAYKKDVLYIPNGVRTEMIEPQPVLRQPYIVFAANRVYEIKGLHLLLEAMHRNNDQRHLVVIGDLEHQGSYKEQILTLSNGLHVTFSGLIKDKQRLFGSILPAEVFVFPSLTEAMSMMLLEVASLGVPLIASDIEANKAVFTNDEVAFFRSGDAGSLADVLAATASDPAQLQQLARNAHERVRSFHQWPVVAGSYRELFDTLTGNNR